MVPFIIQMTSGRIEEIVQLGTKASTISKTTTHHESLLSPSPPSLEFQTELARSEAFCYECDSFNNFPFLSWDNIDWRKTPPSIQIQWTYFPQRGKRKIHSHFDNIKLKSGGNRTISHSRAIGVLISAMDMDLLRTNRASFKPATELLPQWRALKPLQELMIANTTTKLGLGKIEENDKSTPRLSSEWKWIYSVTFNVTSLGRMSYTALNLEIGFRNLVCDPRDTNIRVMMNAMTCLNNRGSGTESFHFRHTSRRCLVYAYILISL